MLFSCFDAGDILRVRSILVRAGRAVLKPMLASDWPPRTLRPEEALSTFVGSLSFVFATRVCYRMSSISTWLYHFDI